MEDVELALREEQEMADNDDGPANRLVSLKRPYGQGLRQKIAAEVAAKWSDRLGKPISGDTVFGHWKKYRSKAPISIALIVDQFK